MSLSDLDETYKEEREYTIFKIVLHLNLHNQLFRSAEVHHIPATYRGLEWYKKTLRGKWHNYYTNNSQNYKPIPIIKLKWQKEIS